jgi:hypothetical protein
MAKRSLTTDSTVKEIFQRELRMRQFSRRWVPPSLGDAEKVARVEAAKEMLRILQESETNDLMASQQATRPGFNPPPHPQKCLPFGGRCHSEDAAGSRCDKTMITVLFAS